MSLAKVLGVLAVAVALLATAGVAWADIAIPNGSFESSTVSYTSSGSAIPGWQVWTSGTYYPGWQVLPNGTINNNSNSNGYGLSAGTATDGNNFMTVYPGGNPVSGDTIFVQNEVASANLVAGTHYTLSASVGQENDTNTPGNTVGPTFELTLFSNLSGTPTTVADTTITTGAAGVWYTETAPAYVPGTSGTTQLWARLTLTGFAEATNGTFGGQWAIDNGVIDNVRITSSPEPATLTLLVTGLIGLLAYAWRRRRA